ncbi:MAG TPA: penicillin-binding transpeptidase domain-containing protein [Oligoflexia bacterium]|nr:penicillin-binding transpeptidase domain-containing protein [Oligoflexia bacterium]HMR23877.1 penicillin-binding transpeptidase domain-containing protein [Oligoflexia bacterium]
MSWKDFQKNNHKAGRQRINVKRLPNKSKVLFSLLAIGICAFLIDVIRPLSHADNKQSSQDQISSITSQQDEKELTWLGLFQNHLDWRVLEHGLNRVVMKNKDSSWQVNLTVEEDLQKYIQKKLAYYEVDFGAIAAINPNTGAVVGLTSYSNKDHKHDYSLRAAFPAASVFKVVTASAALEYKKWNYNTNIRYQGNTKYVTEKNSSTPGGSYKMPLHEAFAKSTNLIFGKIGRMILNKQLLLRKANDYGFAQQIPFDMPLDLSYIKFENDDISVAEVAAGLGDVSLSPVHAAMIAACVSNDGIMMKPYVVKNVVNENDEVLYQVDSKMWKKCLNSEVILDLKKMMQSTIDIGTAKKSFRGYKTNPVLKDLSIGGKTGSKTNLKLKGWNEWFVGYAEQGDEKLAIGIVIVSQKYWKVKPSQLSKDIFQYYFSKKRQKDKKQPKVIEIRSNLDEKKQ